MINMTGLLWLDADGKRNLAEKVARAVKRYHTKFGERPNVCYVHQSALENGSIELEGVRVIPAANVLKHHFFVGINSKED